MYELFVVLCLLRDDLHCLYIYKWKCQFHHVRLIIWEWRDCSMVIMWMFIKPTLDSISMNAKASVFMYNKLF